MGRRIPVPNTTQRALGRARQWLGVCALLTVAACGGEKPPVQRPPADPHRALSPTAAQLAAATSGSTPSSTHPTASSAAYTESAPSPTPGAIPSNSSASQPVLNRELLALRYEAQRRILGEDFFEDAEGKPPASSALERQGPNGYELGQFVAIENESALEPFNEQLERLATGRDSDRKVRILVYGASHTQGDIFTSYLRYYLQSRFGNGGTGFVPFAKLNEWHRLQNASIEEEGFQLQHSLRNFPPHGRLGLLGAASIGFARDALLRVSPRNSTDANLSASEYEVSYGAERGGGDLILLVNEVPQMQLSGRANGYEDRFFRFRMAPGWHQIQVRPAGNGTVRVYGVTIERPEPGIVVDTLGIGGARAASILDWNEAAWAGQVKHRDPALYILAFGTNEAVVTKDPNNEYRNKLTEVINRFKRALPGASCLLVGPFDFPVESSQGFTTRTRLLEIIATQRELAAQHGCGFWDGYKFMGGPGSMHQWVTAAPPLAAADHIHLNHRGYVRMGMSLADAIMRSYDEFHLVVRDWTPSSGATTKVDAP